MSLLEIYFNGATFFVTFVFVFGILRVHQLDSEGGRPFTLTRAIINIAAAAIMGVFYGFLWPVTVPRFVLSIFK